MSFQRLIDSSILLLLPLLKKLLSRKTLAGPVKKAYEELFLTLACRNDKGDFLGTLM